MNKVVTSKEAILSVGKDMVAEVGLQGLNIRDVAKKCGISVGSIYNYFPTKSDFMIATIEAIWREIMQEMTFSAKGHFLESVGDLFDDIRKGSEKFPGFFSSHSMSIMADDKTKGRESMEAYFGQIKRGFLSILDEDRQVRADAFSEEFTKEAFWDFVRNNLITLLVKEADSCDILLEIIRRSIY